MKTLLLAIFIMTGTTAAYAENHGKSFPKSDCNEMFMGIVDLLEEADRQWAFYKITPPIHLMPLNMRRKYNGL